MTVIVDLALSLITMGMFKVGSQGTVFLFVMFPFCLFILTFGSLFSIPALEFLAFRFLRKGETFFAHHQRLILTFLRMIPSGVTRKEPFSLGKYYQLILGTVFIAFGIAVVAQVNLQPRISDGVEVFIAIFVIGIPPIKYLSLFFLYAFHSFASLVPYCRVRFLQDGDFEDPFLSSIYFGRSSWRHLWRYCRGDKSEHSGRKTAGLVFRAFFSKTTASVYLIFASAIFLISQQSLITAGQAFGFVLVVFVLTIPLCATISLPFFMLGSLRCSKFTNEQVKREFAAVTKAEFPREVFFRYVAIARRHQMLRGLSIFASGLWVILGGFAFLVWSGPESATTVMYLPSARVLADERHRATHAICDAKVKNLTLMQIGYLEQLSESVADSEDYNITMDLFPALFGSENLSQIEFLSVPFPDEMGIYFLDIYLHDRRLHVIAIAPTKNLLDWLIDAELWASSVLTSLFRPYVPFLSSFNHVARDYLNSLQSLPRAVFRPLSVCEMYVRRIADYVAGIQLAEDEDVLVTGHSLGGGMAKAVALFGGYATVSWSGPGTSELEGVFGGTETRPNIVSIMPQQDWVAPIDPSDGTTFTLPCKAGPMACHDLRRMVCQMAAMCGTWEETRNRCEAWFDPDAVQTILDLGQPSYTIPYTG
jgi:hypothetical protein